MRPHDALIREAASRLESPPPYLSGKVLESLDLLRRVRLRPRREGAVSECALRVITRGLKLTLLLS